MFIEIGALAAFLTVTLGAFGAHALRGKIPPDLMGPYQTGVQYQGIHALALVAIGILQKISPDSALWGIAGWAFVAGIVLFSGSLYALSVTQIRKFGAITPLGGLAFLLGWAMVFWSAMTTGG